MCGSLRPTGQIRVAVFSKRFSQFQPVLHHPRLRQCEREKHADSIQRYQTASVTGENHDQTYCRDRQDNDPIGKTSLSPGSRIAGA